MNTEQPKTHSFHRDLAEICKWPLVTRDGRKAEVLKWDAKGNFILLGYIDDASIDSVESWQEEGNVYASKQLDDSDLFLSANYSDPRVRAAVQSAHEKLGMEVKWGRFGDAMLGSSTQQAPAFHWEYCDYRLAIHLPAPIAAHRRPSPPKFVPWDFETGPMRVKVKTKASNTIVGIAELRCDGYSVFYGLGYDHDDYSFDRMLKNFVHLDGSPCGRAV